MSEFKKSGYKVTLLQLRRIKSRGVRTEPITICMLTCILFPQRMIDNWIFTVLRPAQELFTYICIWRDESQSYNILPLEDPGYRSSTFHRVLWEATEWGGPLDEIGKTEVPCHSKCGTIKIHPCSKAWTPSIGLNFAAVIGNGDVSI
jgi:hypothetical protein